MTGIPTFKTITMNSHEKRMIYAQLEQYEFGFSPYIFIIHHFVKKQSEALNNIEDYLTENQVKTYPYPIYVVGKVPDYIGPLLLVSDTKFIPTFFKQKERQLNSKEEQIFNKLSLKQQNLNNIQELDYKPILDEYARTHKIISLLNSEKNYLQQLTSQIKETDYE